LKISPNLIEYLGDSIKSGLDNGFETELCIIRNPEAKTERSLWSATIIPCSTAEEIRNHYKHSCNVLVEGNFFF